MKVKKILAVLLALVMVLCIFNVVAFAEGTKVMVTGCSYTGELSSTYVAQDGTKVTFTANDFANGGLIGNSYHEPSAESGEMAIDYVACIGTAMYKTLAEAIAAVKDGETINIISKGTYKLSSECIKNKNVTMTATASGVVIDMSSPVALSGALVTFNNIAFDYTKNQNYVGLYHTATEIYNDCTINGQMFAYGAKAEFNNCVFKQTSKDAYNIWTYGARDIDFDNCTLTVRVNLF